MDAETIKAILDKHGRWLRREEGGERANLYGANLYGADLSRADLSGANLSGADLSRADLSRADLSRANLSGANLSGAYLSGADLSRANLSEANLYEAYLSGAYLYEANLSEANLSRANLSEAKEVHSLAAARLRICPDGAFDSWKKLRGPNGQDVIARLRIPADAKRSNATGRKCRAERVEVLELIPAVEVATSYTAGRLCAGGVTVEYRASETVACDSWCDDRWQECAGGIHFFLTREEAEDWR